MLRLAMPHRLEMTELPKPSIPVPGCARREHAGDDDVEHDDARKGPQHDPQHARTLPGRTPHAQRVIVPTERPRPGLRGSRASHALDDTLQGMEHWPQGVGANQPPSQRRQRNRHHDQQEREGDDRVGA